MADQFSELKDALEAAKQMTTDRIAQFPKYVPYKHVQDQITFIEGFMITRKIPTAAEREKIDIGIMAVKEFDADDPDYAKSLMRLSRRFEVLS